ncbi:MAG: HAD hydrolase-like protein, partial [Lachnospiraceae bacterium]|nr:HAD hydrolase-like protein [Lachnospiraceae bacterium]
EGITQAGQYALQKFGIEEPDLDKLEPFIGPPLKDSFVEFYGLSEGDVIKAVAYYRERYASKGVLENQIFPGMAQMLDMLCEKGIHLAVASSKPIEFVRQILAHFEIEQYFEVIVGSGLDGSRATKEEVVEEALSQLGLLSVPKEERKEICAMIGDRKFDIQGAKAFGLTGVGVRFGFASEGELEAEGADYIINSVEELGLFLTQ